MTVIELPDDQTAVLKAKATAAGLTLEASLRQLAVDEEKPPAARPLLQIANFIVESMKDVPPEIAATMPSDGASQHDHYVYGWPKRDV